MLRRNFLQMLGIGGAASSVLANDFPVKQYSAKGSSLGPSIFPTTLQETPLVEQVAHARREYEMFTQGGKYAFIQRTIRDWKEDGVVFKYEDLDQDLQDMKSWSKVTKLRVHMERKAEHRWRSSERYLVDRISSLLGMEKKDDRS